MTIIAGFRCVDGVVICGDTQATTGISKTQTTKVTVVPEGVTAPSLLKHANLMAVFCGAGDGPFTEMLIRKAWKSAEHATDLEQACDFIESNIEDVYKHYGEIYQRGYCPSVSLIYGVKMNGESRLFAAEGEIVNPVDTYTSSGAGQYMANFLSSRMYQPGLTVHQCAILASYVLFQAKEHVDGCGGESHIAVLRNEGKSDRIDQSRVRAITRLLEKLDQNVGNVLIAAADLRDTSPISEEVSLLGRIATQYRDQAKKEIKAFDIAEAIAQGGFYVDGGEFYARLDDETEIGTKDDLGFIKGLTILRSSEDQEIDEEIK